MDKQDEQAHVVFYDELEKELVLIANLLRNMPDDMRAFAARRIIFEAMNWGSFNDYEAVGIAEHAKKDYLEALSSVEEDSDAEAGDE